MGNPQVFGGWPRLAQHSMEQPCSVRSSMDFEFLEEVVHVVLHCCHLNTEANRDLLVREVLLEQAANFALSSSQRHFGEVLLPLRGKCGNPPNETPRQAR